MLPPRIRHKSKRENDGKKCPRHLKFVRSFACSVPGCQRWPIEAHHIRTAANSGTGMKPADRWVISLCLEHHNEVHNGQETFEAKYGLDPTELAGEFARKSPHWPMLREML